MHKFSGESHDEKVSEWHDAIYHMLTTYKPTQLSLYFGEIQTGIQGDFTVELPDGPKYSGLMTQKRNILVLLSKGQGYTPVQVMDSHTKRSILVYANSKDSRATICASQPNDCELLDRSHIECTAIVDLRVRFDLPLMKEVNGASNYEALYKWQDAIRHVLQVFKPRKLSVHFGEVKPEIIRDFCVNLPDGSKYSGLLTQQHDILALFLLGQGFRQVQDMNSHRSIIVFGVEDSNALVWAAKSSDCKLLQRHHIPISTIEHLTVRFDVDILYGLNGPVYRETSEEWHDAVRHLLYTFRPKQLNIYFGNLKFEMESGFSVKTPDQRVYSGVMIEKQDLLLLFWHGRGFRHIKDPDSSRSVIVYKAEGETAEIWASQPSDCTLLQREHIQCATVANLQVRFDEPLIYDINGPAHHATLDVWHDAIQHILDTYRPMQVCISLGTMDNEMKNSFTVDLPDGRVYTGLMAKSRDTLRLLSHCHGFRHVRDPASDRSIIVGTAEGTQANILVSDLTDCKLLHRGDVQCDSVTKMTVNLGTNFMDKINEVSQNATLSKWHDAIRHLLQTFKPKWLHIYFGEIETGKSEGCTNLDEQPLTKKQDLVDSWHNLAFGERISIDLKYDGKVVLLLYRPDVFGTPGGWQIPIDYAFNMFDFDTLNIKIGSVNPNIPDGMEIAVSDGRKYVTTWSCDSRVLCITRRHAGFQCVNVPGCSRSVFVMKTQGETAIAAASRPSDCLTLKRGRISSHHIKTLYVRFDDTFTKSVNGESENEPRASWDKAIRHLLYTFQPERLIVQPGHLELDTGIGGEVSFQPGNGRTYHAYWNEKHDSLVIEWHAKSFKQVKDPDSHRSILITRAEGEDAEIWASQPSDCRLLQRDHIQCVVVESIIVKFDEDYMYDVNGATRNETRDEWRGAMHHLLHIYRPNQLIVRFGPNKPPIDHELTVSMSDGGKCTGLLNRNRDALTFVWHGRGFRRIKDPDSSRSVIVYKAEGEDAEIWASQPSDCRLLQRDHIQCATVANLQVRFDKAIMDDINGAAQADTSENWIHASHHLLGIYQPLCLYLQPYKSKLDGKSKGDVSIALPTGKSYIGLSSCDRDQLILFLNSLGFRKVEVPESTRCILIISAEGTSAEILASKAIDCLSLGREDIQCTQIDVLKIRFDKAVMDRLNGPVKDTSTEEWHKMIQHVLLTYCPAQLYLHFGGEKLASQEDLAINLPDGRMYSSLWSADHKTLILF